MVNLEEYSLPAMYVIGALAAVQLLYWAIFMFRIRRKKNAADGTKKQPATIIVCAKNEDTNLQRLIPKLFKQKYPEYQVVIVDDCSSDDTAMVLAQLKVQYPQLYYTSIPIDRKFAHGKKLAVTVGIKAAKYEHMVFIDADCVPASDMWLDGMMSCYGGQKQIVIGYGRYAKLKGFLNFFIRYETFWNAVQYFGFAAAFRPFMGVGRNLSYTKTIYEQSSKFRNTLRTASGDDDTFIAEMGTRANTAICFSPEAQTISDPKTTWHEWFDQKARHLTTARYYPAGIKFLLGLETLSRQLFFIAAVLLLVFGDDMLRIVTGSTIFVRWVVMYISLGIAAARMGEKSIYASAFLMDILVPWLQAVAWLNGALSKSSNTWR